MNDQPKYQWSAVFTKQVNGISVNENFTFRVDDKEELIKLRQEVLDKYTGSSKSFPDDEGQVAHTETQPEQPVCPLHGQTMVYRPAGVAKGTGRPYPGFWACTQKKSDGKYCNGREN